jgi:hypothetical protein
MIMYIAVITFITGGVLVNEQEQTTNSNPPVGV